MQLPDLPQTERLIIEMTNAFRAGEKRAPVKPNALLAKAAEAFAAYLADTGRFGHTVDGRQPADRTAIAGYKHCIVAENLAMNQDSRGFSAAALAAEAVTGWKNSPPHRAAMLNADVTEVGIGIARSRDAAPKFLSVQLFGRPESFKYTFEVHNLAGVPLRYSFQKETIDLPRNTAITQSACTPDRLTVNGIAGAFTASDGAIYRISKSPSGTLEVEVTRR